jgi:hypothetical protein
MGPDNVFPCGNRLIWEFGGTCILNILMRVDYSSSNTKPFLSGTSTPPASLKNTTTRIVSVAHVRLLAAVPNLHGPVDID